MLLKSENHWYFEASLLIHNFNLLSLSLKLLLFNNLRLHNHENRTTFVYREGQMAGYAF